MRMALGLGLHAGKHDALAGVEHLDAVEALVEVEMPPGAAEFAVGRELEADLLLLPDDLLDLAIFDGLEVGVLDLALGVLGARLFQRRGAQQAADVVGAEWRVWYVACYSLSCHARRA